MCCYIRKTCPYNVNPLSPHFCIVRLGYAGVYLFLLFLLQNIDCGYSLEPPRRGGSNVYPQSMFWGGGSNEYPQSMFWSKNNKNNKNLLLKSFNFYNLKKSLYITWVSFRNEMWCRDVWVQLHQLLDLSILPFRMKINF